MPAPRRAAALKTFAPPSASPLARAEASLLALLTAIEPHEPDAPAAKAYRATMRARGFEIAAAGGTEALDYLLARIRAADPSRADVREALLDLAWSGLSAWRS